MLHEGAGRSERPEAQPRLPSPDHWGRRLRDSSCGGREEESREARPGSRALRREPSPRELQAQEEVKQDDRTALFVIVIGASIAFWALLVLALEIITLWRS